MRIPVQRILLTAVLALTALSSGYAAPAKPAPKSGDEGAIRQFVQELAAAFSHNDVAALDRVMTPDYSFVTPTGAVQTKEERLAPLKAGSLKYEQVIYDEVSVRSYGTMAVVVSHVAVKGKNNGVSVDGQFRATLTLAKTKGRWQMVASQANRIQ
jgi:uncharacterized protein (TIGR02246 family)